MKVSTDQKQDSSESESRKYLRSDLTVDSESVEN